MEGKHEMARRAYPINQACEQMIMIAEMYRNGERTEWQRECIFFIPQSTHQYRKIIFIKKCKVFVLNNFFTLTCSDFTKI